MKDKIMSEGKLDAAIGHLTSCIAMLAVVHASMSDDGDVSEALWGCINFLSSISRDLEAGINSAKDYISSEEVAA